MKGAPKVTRESKAQPAQSENPSNPPVRALPSAFRDWKAKKIAPSDKANPQITGLIVNGKIPKQQEQGDPNANPITRVAQAVTGAR